MTYQEIVKAEQADTPTAITTLAGWEQETKALNRKATDIMSEPIIQDGYQKSGKTASISYVHLTMMAISRLKKHFPLFDAKDPVMARLLAEAKVEVAKCMLLKYECRAQRKSYDHLRDCDVQVNKVVRDHYDRYVKDLKEIGYAGT